MAPKGNSSAAVSIPELGLVRKALKELGDADATKEFKDANQGVAKFVVDRASARFAAMGPAGVRAAKALRAVRSGYRAEIVLNGDKYPDALGVEFGAYRNKLRLRKNTGGRAYIVHKESKRQIRKAIERIEAQSRLRHETVKAGTGGTQVKVTGQIRGWNQFKEWRGNKTGAGYALFPTIRENQPEIAEQYGEAIDDLKTKYGF